MISQKMQDACNEQINFEMTSSYLYLSMAAHLEVEGFDGMGAWMRVQAHEEMLHAMKLFDHVIGRGGKVVLMSIEKPKNSWESATHVFEESYAHEQMITGRIHQLMKLAHEESDFAAVNLLNWFVDEQVEEEESVSKIVNQLRLIKDSGQGLVMLDRELSSRQIGTISSTTEK